MRRRRIIIIIIIFNYTLAGKAVVPVQTMMARKDKVDPITCHEDTQRVYKCSSTLSLTLALDESGWLTLRPNRFYPRHRDSVPIL